MKKLLLSFLAISMSALAAQAFSIEALRFHCADDTTRINQILHEAVSNTSLKSAGSYMSFFADKLLHAARKPDKNLSISEPVHYEQDTKKVIVLIKKVA